MTSDICKKMGFQPLQPVSPKDFLHNTPECAENGLNQGLTDYKNEKFPTVNFRHGKTPIVTNPSLTDINGKN